MRSILVGAVLVAMVAACSPGEDGGGGTTAATAMSVAPTVPTGTAVVEWEEPADYTFVLYSSCGERRLIGRFSVTVRDHMVDDVEALDQSARAALQGGGTDFVPTLGDVLAEAAAARAGGADRVGVRFDPVDGHPVLVDIDHEQDAVDDEACYEVTGYTVDEVYTAGTAPLQEGWVELPAAPLSARLGAHALWTGEELFVIGGSDDPCPPGADCVFEDLALSDGAAYDPTTGEWRTIATAPAPLGPATGVVHEGALYFWVYGGLASAGMEQMLLRYDPGSDQWTRVPLPDPEPEWPQLATSSTGLVLYRGSYEVGRGPDLLFDPDSSDWTEIPSDPLEPAYDRTMVDTPEGLVLLGIGSHPVQDAGPPFYGAAVLDTEAMRWERLEDAPIVGWSPTWYHVAELVVNPTAGRSDGGEADGWARSYPRGGMLDPVAGEWLPLPDPPGRRGMLLDHTAGGDRYLLAHDGWVLDPAAETWTRTDGPPVVPNEGAAVAWMRETLVVWGGVVWGPGDGELVDTGWTWRPPDPD